MEKEKEHPIESLMVTAMSSLESMVDVNTIVGDIVTTTDGTLIIPVSKVTFGFAAGGSEFNTNKLNKYSESAKLPFGGGSGAGVSIAPMAFLVVKDGYTNLLTLNNSTPIDKLIELIPDLMNKINDFVNRSLEKKPKDIEDINIEE
jgi:sporulation protein YtfJ